MTEEEKAIKAKADAVAASEAKEGEGVTDLEVELASTQAALDKAVTDRDNYKKGMLKAKGKLDPEDADDDRSFTLDDVNALVEKKFQEARVFELQNKKDALLAQALKERKEALLALKNKSGIGHASSGAGSSGYSANDIKAIKEGKTTVDKFFTPEQIAELERRSAMAGVKIDPAKVMENIERRRAKSQL